mgnify:CR=1 FL=1
MPDPIVYAADIGSVAGRRFGWSRLPALPGPVGHGDIGELSARVAADLAQGLHVALGFEAPQFVPVRRDPSCLTFARKGEGARPWSAGAGCGALATSLPEVVWILERVTEALGSTPKATLSLAKFCSGSGQLLLWEAFVTGAAKADSHEGDAALAAQEFLRRWPDVRSDIDTEQDPVRSLVGATLLRAGYSEDLALLRQECLVVRV